MSMQIVLTSLAFFAAAILAGVMGFAIQRGATCTVAALDEVPEDLRLCARTLGASSRYTMLRVQIRAALPGAPRVLSPRLLIDWIQFVSASARRDSRRVRKI